MPGRHINDHQMRLYMKSRLTVKKPAAAAQAAISLRTAYRIKNDPDYHRRRRGHEVGGDPIHWSRFLKQRSCRC